MYVLPLFYRAPSLGIDKDNSHAPLSLASAAETADLEAYVVVSAETDASTDGTASVLVSDETETYSYGKVVDSAKL